MNKKYAKFALVALLLPAWSAHGMAYWNRCVSCVRSWAHALYYNPQPVAVTPASITAQWVALQASAQTNNPIESCPIIPDRSLQRAKILMNHIAPALANGNELPQRERAYLSDNLFVEIEEEEDALQKKFTIILSKIEHRNEKEVGTLLFTYIKGKNEIFFDAIIIKKSERGNGYGNMLIKFVSERFKEYKDCKISGSAVPHHLRKGETGHNMLPRLIKFYKKFGAKVVKIEREVPAADMEFVPAGTVAQERARKIVAHIIGDAMPHGLSPVPTRGNHGGEENIKFLYAEEILDAENQIKAYFNVYEVIDTPGRYYVEYTMKEIRIGECEVLYNEQNQAAYITDLKIASQFRAEGFGTELCAYIARFLAQKGCKDLRWVPSPYDFKSNQTEEELYPKLIHFYERLGAQFDQTYMTIKLDS